VKKVIVLISFLMVAGCASVKPLKSETATAPAEVSYSKDQVRRACWKGIKQACGLKGSCYEKAGNYCETDKLYQDVTTPVVPKK
jgi:hypothetical protein